MNGDTFGYVILPDMMQVSNPLLILAFIPIFDYAIYPLLCKAVICPAAASSLDSNGIFTLAKYKLLTTPLQRMVAGGMLACLSFVVSGCLEIALEVSSLKQDK